ncbi:MAG: hypothetical protein K2X93_13570, partial [Candidatus Obscuribacterales bacterium]|nr:hypothetical protein [Candidatus Obscuribacterales bacterium]
MSASANELGELLMDLGLITPEELEDAMQRQAASGSRLSVVLSEMGLVSERQLKDALELQYGVNFINLSGVRPDDAFVRSVPEEVERQFRFVPVSKQGSQFSVAMVDPDDLKAADAVKLHLGSGSFKKLVCTADDFDHLMYLTYVYVEETAVEPDPEPVAELEPEAEPEPPPKPKTKTVSEKPLPQVAKIPKNKITAAKSPRASQSRIKAQKMRDLFAGDSDDDLDSMFGETEQPTATEPEPIAAPIAAKASSKSKVSSIRSLFGDDDDDDFGESEPEPEPEPEPQLISEPPQTKESSQAIRALPTNQLLEHILQEAGATKPKGKKAATTMQSLFDDDDDEMGFSDDDSNEPSKSLIEVLEADAGGPVPSAESEPESEVDKELEPEPEPEQEPEPELEPELESEPEAEPEPEFESDPEFESAPEIEPEPGISEDEDAPQMPPSSLFDQEPEIEPFEGESPTAEAQLQDNNRASSLFEDDVDEENLFGNSEGLTSEPTVSKDMVPEAVAEPAQDDLEEESPESLLDAIEKPFESLFDEGNDELFGSDESSEGGQSDDELPEPNAISSVGDPGLESESEEEPPLAYGSLYEDDVDEVGLFSSASHPVLREGVPGLRDLLSRFDDEEPAASEESEAAIEAPDLSEDESAEEVQYSEAGDMNMEPEPVGLPIGALLAAFDEQVPDGANVVSEESETEDTEPVGLESEATEPVALPIGALLAAFDEQIPDGANVVNEEAEISEESESAAAEPVALPIGALLAAFDEQIPDGANVVNEEVEVAEPGTDAA